MKTVYVDFDGTIVDVMPRYHGILESYIKREKFIEIDFNKYKSLKRKGIKDYDIVKRLCEGNEIDLEDYLKFKRLNLENFKWLKKDIIIGSPEEAYHKLQNQGYRVVLLTQRYIEKNLHKQVKMLNIEKCFDEIIVVKPLPNQNAKIKYLKNIINIEDIIIGDSRDEMETAEKLNIAGFFVTSGLWNESFAGPIAQVFNNYNTVVDYIVGERVVIGWSEKL
jgi:phosphoglycolate phosphatase-like HAD superfamily hydrolase